ncbi:substrate-binding domain-containing protein [Arthrobacter sp. VKM Ac-2550]|uniref:substrate-binding domain-containing protein n=1 Tax=Crystallibacter permensis TaxID=1938888 RepID=UPI002225E57D|nr:substrate-binding domain-containing protein [Arthrobacter sp. VKM Ac-2550]MCW2130873.1 substrate-binding protein domain-containing protein [Arthrobacter sp. VKM Ac-2550]
MNTIRYRSIAATVSVAATLGMVGCTSAPTEAAPPPESIESMALMVQDLSNPFFAAMVKGAEEAAEELDATLNVQDARLDLANQSTQIDAFIQGGVDLIVISAVHQAGIAPAIERAKQAGVIVIAVDTPAR